jgi:hypothetical protein
MNHIIEKTVEDIINGNLEIRINQSQPINTDYSGFKIDSSSSGAIALVTSEERLKKQEMVIRKFPFKSGSGQIKSDKTSDNWLF